MTGKVVVLVVLGVWQLAYLFVDLRLRYWKWRLSKWENET